VLIGTILWDIMYTHTSITLRFTKYYLRYQEKGVRWAIQVERTVKMRHADDSGRKT